MLRELEKKLEELEEENEEDPEEYDAWSLEELATEIAAEVGVSKRRLLEVIGDAKDPVEAAVMVRDRGTWTEATKRRIIDALLERAEGVELEESSKGTLRKMMVDYGTSWIPVIPTRRWITTIIGESGGGKTLMSEAILALHGENFRNGCGIDRNQRNIWRRIARIATEPTMLVIDDVQKGHGPLFVWDIVEIVYGSSGRPVGSVEYGLDESEAMNLKRSSIIMTWQADDESGRPLPGRTSWRTARLKVPRSPKGMHVEFLLDIERYRDKYMEGLSEAADIRVKDGVSPGRKWRRAAETLVAATAKAFASNLKLEAAKLKTGVILKTTCALIGGVPVGPEMCFDIPRKREEVAERLVRLTTSNIPKTEYEKAAVLVAINESWMNLRVPGVEPSEAIERVICKLEFLFDEHVRVIELLKELL